MGIEKQFEPTSSASPEDLKNSMDVDWEFLRIQEPLQTMDYWLHIVMIDEIDNTC